MKRPGEEGIKGGKAGGKGEGERASDGLLYGQFARVQEKVEAVEAVRGVSEACILRCSRRKTIDL